MTRSEFLEDIRDYADLKSFCYDNDCDLIDDVYSEEERDEDIENYTVDWARTNKWRDLFNILSDLDANSGYDWYRREYADEWEILDNGDFRSDKEAVLEWMDEGGYWDDEDEDEEEPLPFTDEEEPAEDDDPGFECEAFAFSLSDLSSAGIGCIQMISKHEEEEEQQAKLDFAQFIG